MTDTFCGILREFEATGKTELIVLKAQRDELAASTKAAADYVVKLGDAARLRRFLNRRSDAEKTQIVKYLKGGLR
jgi:hypothetical protein